MKELDYQKLIIDVVRTHGGAAFKLSNRFLVGVSDLLVKLPALPPALLEVKLDAIPVKSNLIGLSVTVPQKRFLAAFGQAGMHTGIVSIIHKKGLFGIWIGLDLVVPLDDYFIGKMAERKAIIWSVLEKYLEA